ncbi:DUF732 domain-containing protein [Kitasatospora sp. NPDC049285]|uniref:DUF732 domain-containing protein n=1 Tax=Kitasatospora sp. NPDC049285 TaxID=3157096 RepID=UPI00341C4328
MRTRALAACLAAAALLTLTACNNDGSADSAPSTKAAPASSTPAATSSTPAPIATPSTGASTTAASSGAPTAGVPTPNAAQAAGLMAALRAADPNIATDQTKAITLARSVCQEIKAGKDDAALATFAAQRFSAGTVTLTPEQGAVIVASVKAAFCS